MMALQWHSKFGCQKPVVPYDARARPFVNVIRASLYPLQPSPFASENGAGLSICISKICQHMLVLVQVNQSLVLPPFRSHNETYCCPTGRRWRTPKRTLQTQHLSFRTVTWVSRIKCLLNNE